MPVLAHLTTRAINSASNPAVNNDPANQRSLWNILWSCAVTVFACTWIAVHPNIPAADDTLLMIAARRAGLMLCGMVAPEIIILWAMRQWYSARKIGRRHKGKGWTTTHGFFIQMGGFMMYDGTKPPYPIQLDDLVARYTKGEIDWPEITEREIQDRSKGDAFSKGVVVFQTSWFLVQCIGRGVVGLAMTELELVTLAFAALNGVTYFFWWNKPADVQCTHPVYLRRPQGHYAKYITHTTSESTDNTPRSSKERLFRLIHSIWTWLKPVLPPLYTIYKRGSPFGHMFVYIRRPAIFLMKFFVGIVLPMTGKMNDFTSMKRVPTFYAARFESGATPLLVMTLACALIGSAFGGIHCIAWSFQFSSPIHQLLWKTSSLVITCAPLTIALASTHMSHQNPLFKRFITPMKYRNPVSRQASSKSDSTLDSEHITLDQVSFELNTTHSQPTGFAPPTGVGTFAEPQQSYPHVDLGDVVNNAEAHFGSTTVLPPVPPPFIFDLRMSVLMRAVIWSIKCTLLACTTAAYIAARVILVVQALIALKTLSLSELQEIEWTSFIPHV